MDEKLETFVIKELQNFRDFRNCIKLIEYNHKRGLYYCLINSKHASKN
jgi:hypothetical protein